MPVLNGATYVDEAIESVLAQSLGDFEFVILDDGAADDTRERLRSWAQRDVRIRILEGERSLGPAGSSAAVVAEARAPLVARMDADDRAHPQRLAAQREEFERHSDLVLLGSVAETIDAVGSPVRPPDLARLVRPSPFAPFGHSSIMFRKDAFERAGGYRDAARKWEDVDLYLRLAETGLVMVLTRPLVQVRQWEASSRIAHGLSALEDAMDLMYRCISEYCAGRGLDALLIDPPKAHKLRPESFVAASARLVWTGRAPGVTPRLWRRAALGLDRTSLATLVWAAWADLSPRSLRLALRGLLAVRNRRARRILADRTVVQWRPQEARFANVHS